MVILFISKTWVVIFTIVVCIAHLSTVCLIVIPSCKNTANCWGFSKPPTSATHFCSPYSQVLTFRAFPPHWLKLLSNPRLELFTSDQIVELSRKRLHVLLVWAHLSEPCSHIICLLRRECHTQHSTCNNSTVSSRKGLLEPVPLFYLDFLSCWSGDLHQQLEVQEIYGAQRSHLFNGVSQCLSFRQSQRSHELNTILECPWFHNWVLIYALFSVGA